MTGATEDFAGWSNAQLMRREIEIARRHSGQFPWAILIWAFGNLACWLALWSLVLTGTLPLLIAFPIATLNMMLVYLPTHEAQHHIIGRPGTRWHLLNEFLGHATSWMMVTPFEVFRQTHLEHHKHANDPALDPDHAVHAAGPWTAIWASIRERQPNGKRALAYEECLARLGRADLLLLTVAYQFAFLAALCALAWNGFALEAFFLWWLPLQIALTYVDFFLSWAPHHPATSKGRYRDTRSFRSKLGNIGSMGMQFHIVHHLHPYIPLTRTPVAYWEMRPLLEVRGCHIHDL